MATMTIDGHTFVIGPFECKAPAGFSASVTIDHDQYFDGLLPIMHEVHGKVPELKQIIAYIDDSDPTRKVKIVFAENEMTSFEMRARVEALLRQSIVLYAQRQREMAKPRHPSASDVVEKTESAQIGLVRVGPDRHHDNTKKARRAFKNVPPRLRDGR